MPSLSARRAWIEIANTCFWRPFPWWSLSARRAWIEMTSLTFCNASFAVALRKESVDRNIMVDDPSIALTASLSARRAWIEIFTTVLH